MTRHLYAIGALSTESIKYQENKACFNELVMLFRKLRDANNDGDKADYTNQIEAATLKHTGIKAKLTIDEQSLGAYTLIPKLSKNHPLYSSIMYLDGSDGLKIIRTAKKTVTGGIDYKRGMVNGVFSEVIADIHLPALDIHGHTSFSVEELTAIYLHEVGHSFTYFEYLSRTITTNQILSGVSKALDGSNTPEQREIVLREVAKQVNLANTDIDSLSKTTDKKVIEIVLLEGMRRGYASETGYDIYDIVSSEMLADQYAVRMGAGRYIVTGLDKLYKKYSNISYRSSVEYFFIEATKVTFIIAATVTAGFALQASVILYLAALTMISADASGTGMAARYDTVGRRFERVRADLVEQLKNKKLNKDVRDGLIDDIAVIDKIMAGIKDRRQWFGVLYDSITTNRRKNRDMKVLQYELERLVANDLFITASKFENIKL